MDPSLKPPATRVLSAQDLLAGSALVHEVAVPPEVLHPRSGAPAEARTVRLRPLSVGTLALISRASRDEPSLVPLLMIKEAMVEPAITLEQARQMHVGLVHFLTGQINQISGLTLDGESHADVLSSSIGTTHIMLARHFGWTPEQVSQLTPAQVMVYLAGIEKLLEFERSREEA
jgi:hypothetical protein